MTDTTVITRMLFAIDALDWATVRKCLADQVELDYTSLFGGEPQTIAADTLLEQWSGLLPGFDATQHLTGPVVETADDRIETHVRAVHVLGDEVWGVHGHYVADLRDDRICALTLRLFYQDGNRDLPAAALERAKTSPRH
ncbi:hypothetical protein GCM10009765_74930 [Fodinicola feengrottensis]|uniref:SnoaL-like domain-containing protein n=1 Tax=Fodinicola feengrottensis TaxID=435914 RepID=A0ABN2IZS7_9ACTN